MSPSSTLLQFMAVSMIILTNCDIRLFILSSCHYGLRHSFMADKNWAYELEPAGTSTAEIFSFKQSQNAVINGTISTAACASLNRYKSLGIRVRFRFVSVQHRKRVKTLSKHLSRHLGTFNFPALLTNHNWYLA